MTSTDSTTRRGIRPLIAVAAVAVIVVAALVVAGSSNDDAQSAASATGLGPPAPATAFTFFDGTTASFSDYAGQPLVVNFWASWCPSCVAEMSAAFRPVQERMGDTVAFLGLNIQDERSRAVALVEETGVLFDLAEDPTGELYTELGGIGMPFTVFISPAGEVVHAHNGPVTEAQLEELIVEHLGT